MSEGGGNRMAMDPTALWRQWYEAGTKMWSSLLGGGREGFVDPFGLYRQWFNGLEEVQKSFSEAARSNPMTAPFAAALNGSAPSSPMFAPFAALNPATAAQGESTSQGAGGDPKAAATMGAAEAQNLWKQYFEAVNDSLRQAGELGSLAAELTPRWLETLEQIRNNLFAAEGYPTDPLQFATRLYNATNGPLSEFVGDLIEREEFLEPSSQLMHNYASFYRYFRRNAEENLRNLSIPVRSDIERVAGLVVALEDKVDRIEDAVDDFEFGPAEQPATPEAVASIEERLGRIEDALQSAQEDSADGSAGSGLEERLDNVEAKIDRLLAALENAPQNSVVQASDAQEASSAQQEEGGSQEEGSEEQQSDGSEAAVLATNAARRKAQELEVDLSEVEGTGKNGQITVDDVRRASARS